MSNDILNRIYKHYKGNLYECLGTVTESTNDQPDEVKVLYRGTHGKHVRRYQEFFEEVAVGVPRFRHLTPEEAAKELAANPELWIVFDDNAMHGGLDEVRTTLVCSREEFCFNPTHWVKCSQQATVLVMDGAKVVATISCPRVEE